jgi:hypothetical protein
MHRSSLTALIILATAACAPEVDPLAEVAHEDQALTLSTVNATVSKSLTASAVTLVRTPKQPAADTCDSYDGYTAAIASRTIDCLGTIGPQHFTVDDRGNLRRTFKECSQDKEALEDIDALLSLQLRKETLPEAQRCIAGRWSTWHKTFTASEIQSCPLWKKVETINAPTEAGVAEYAKTLPKLPARENGVKPAVPHENYIAELRYPDDKVDPRCKDEADCAQRCIGGFAGAWVEGSGTKAIIDPTFWLLGVDFTGTNPFLTPGYYHPMSYHGSVPGALYGHRYREGEVCSRYIGGFHYLFTLQLDCIDPNIFSSCVTRCDETPVATTGTGSDAQY